LRSKQSFYIDIQRYSISVIYSVLHGRCVPQYETEEITGYIAVMHEWSALLEPGAVPPVDAIPILKHIPERWAKWKRDCKRVRDLQRARYFRLVEETSGLEFTDSPESFRLKSPMKQVIIHWPQG
jgi:hypothetical protein